MSTFTSKIISGDLTKHVHRRRARQKQYVSTSPFSSSNNTSHTAMGERTVFDSPRPVCAYLPQPHAKSLPASGGGGEGEETGEATERGGQNTRKKNICFNIIFSGCTHIMQNEKFNTPKNNNNNKSSQQNKSIRIKKLRNDLKLGYHQQQQTN
jgi:hypothetical protein